MILLNTPEKTSRVLWRFFTDCIAFFHCCLYSLRFPLVVHEATVCLFSCFFCTSYSLVIWLILNKKDSMVDSQWKFKLSGVPLTLESQCWTVLQIFYQENIVSFVWSRVQWPRIRMKDCFYSFNQGSGSSIPNFPYFCFDKDMMYTDIPILQFQYRNPIQARF